MHMNSLSHAPVCRCRWRSHVALCAAVALILPGVSTAQQPGSSVQAATPTYRVGDRWTYRASDGFLLPSKWVETREVVAIGAEGITVRITQKGEAIDAVRTELWAAPGRVRVGALRNDETRHFVAPLQRYNFPLTPGQSWNQWVDKDEHAAEAQGRISLSTQVEEWEKVSTPAGTFDAIRVQVAVRDDELHAWRLPTTARSVSWYSPDVRGNVREESDAHYIEYGKEGPKLHAHHLLLELTAFAPGQRTGH